MRFNSRARAGQPRLLRTWRGSQKTRSENSFDGLRVLRRSQQTFTPLRENRPDLVGVFFGEEVMETGLKFEKRGIERGLGAIVRMEVELAFGRSVVRIKRKGEIAQACGNQSRRGSLATPDQKVAATRVDWMRIDKMTRLLPPTQRKAPQIHVCG